MCEVWNITSHDKQKRLKDWKFWDKKYYNKTLMFRRIRRMYKIYFETSNINKKVKDWQDKLFNDFHKALEKKVYCYKTKNKTLQRLKFISDREISKINFNKDSVMILKNKEYGKRKEDIKIWGLPQGYIDLNKRLAQAESKGIEKIKISDFYDIRQNASKIFKNSYLVIEYKK